MPRREKTEKKGGKGIWKTLFGIGIIAGSAFGLLTYFASAEVIVFQKREEVKLDVSLTANLEAGGDVPYRMITIEKDAAATVPAASQKQVESKATGTVVIYNAYSAEPYRLIKNTRLEAPSGLIFKISETVVVPGKKTEGGKTVPGSAEVSIFADSNGPEYNVGFVDFTIPGFKGSPQYSAFYARSKTSIGGGWSGMKKIASEEDISKADAKLRADLSEILLKTAVNEIPEDYVLLKGAYTVSFVPAESEQSDAGVVVGEHAIFRGALFSKADIAKIALKKSLQKAVPASQVEGIESLQVTPKGNLENALAGNASFSFSLAGPAVIKSPISVPDLQKSLAAAPRDSIQKTLALFPGIEKVEVGITPFWKNSFPKDPARIDIIIR